MLPVCKKSLVKAVVTGVVACLIGSCGKMGAEVECEESGMVAIQVKISSGLAKASKSLKVDFDSLVLEISADDMVTIRNVEALDLNSSSLVDTLTRIPVGKDRKVVVYTINKTGQKIHEDSNGERLISIEPNEVTLLPVKLIPLLGSIYLQLSGIPTTVDSISVTFTTDRNDVYASKVGRSAKVNVNLDGIPDKSKGVLMVAGLSAVGDTLYKAEKTVEIDAKNAVSTQLSFQGAPGNVAVTAEIQTPGVTLVAASMGGVPVADSEAGNVIITEIMYAANDSEYVELYNSNKERVVFDTLIMDIDGVKRVLYNISIEAEKYFVIGRVSLPWSDIALTVKSALDLSSSGNWITITKADGTVVDQVAFTGGTNQLEWPKVTGKQSICLSKDAYSATGNNFGRSWSPAASLIEGSTSQQGTPHK